MYKSGRGRCEVTEGDRGKGALPLLLGKERKIRLG